MSMSQILPVVVAALAAWLIGAVWYSPLLFAKAWVKAHGYTDEKIAAMRANAGKTYAGSFVAFLLMAGVLSIFLHHLGVDDPMDGIGWSFHAWLGFALPLGFIAWIYSDKAIATFLIDTGYQLTYLVVMGAILGAWV
ncbi:MAG: DUF1761 domain-containing protein [Gemmatimonadota bacterium]